MGWHGPRIVFDLLLKEIDCGLELCVASRECCVWEIVDDDVRVDAMAFDEPLAVGAVHAVFRGCCNAVVGLDVASGEPDFAAPGAGSDDFAHGEMLEAFGEGFAVGGSFLIAKNNDVAAESILHIPGWIADAGLPVEPGFAQQIVEEP